MTRGSSISSTVAVQFSNLGSFLGQRLLVTALLCGFLAIGCMSVTTTTTQLEVVFPFRYPLRYAPAWFGNIVLPPGRVQAKVTYGGDACESLLGRTPVRNTLVLVDRGRCSFIQKAVHVEQAGGIAMIIVNDTNEYFIMTEDGTGRTVRLSSFLISRSDGEMLKAEIVCETKDERSSKGCDPESKGVFIGWGMNFQPRAHYMVV